MAQQLRTGLTPEHFAHPLDKGGMQRLQNRLLTSELLKEQLEKFQADAEEEFYLLNLADNTKLSEAQGGSLYRLVQEVAETLRAQTPHVFLDTAPTPNAYALGGTNPSIVLTSALIDTFPLPALRAVIAHELGHIICRHTFYRMLAEHFDLLSNLVSLIPVLGSVLSLGMRWALLDWYRKSELSADRAALLGTQDSEAVQECIMRLAGGASGIAMELSLVEFSTQAREFQERMKAKREQSLRDRVEFLFSGFMLQHAMSTHPWPAVRLQEIRRWAESKQYMLLVAGDYEAALTVTPPITEADQWVAFVPPGEDIKDYVTDLGRVAKDVVKGFLKRLAQPGDNRRLKPSLLRQRYQP
jgi:Zn-dependent protease with chaperone function